ncbi:MAG: exodeoxyribonuclease V subunit gamma [Desulfobacterota bacterium]|nr:exodeoxyribonuclease V subunit gamma [Thermodesulfobacteriota bacterium]
MPGLHIYTGNRLEVLAEQLAQLLRENPLPPLQQEIVVVQSRGMEHWLCLEIARHNRICANVAFPFPRAFAYRLFASLVPLPDPSPFDPEVMVWGIMKHLPQLISHEAFRPVQAYLTGDAADVKLFQLARKIASVFDQYLVYRPDMIHSWDKAEMGKTPDSIHAHWQLLLWQQLSADAGEPTLHPASLKERFIDAVRNGEFNHALPPRISVFGISTLPPYYLEIFSALAQIVDVFFFYLNPCREYWRYIYTKKEIERFTRDGITPEDGYFEQGNSLLASLGVCGREFFSLLDTMTEWPTKDFYLAPGTASMLACIQSDILMLHERRYGESPDAVISDSDTSIQIHSCHSPLREVEVLSDNLLALFEADPSLLPQDIVVMTPDITVYAPLVQAVFDTPEHPSRQIPYTIADIPLAMESGVAGTLLSILTIDRERFRASAVLDILEQPAVLKKFGLSENDMHRIRQWAVDAGICWGSDAASREQYNLPPFHEHSWRFGIDRLLLGYSMPEHEGVLFSNIRPCGNAEGDAAQVLGAFVEFVEALMLWSRELTRPRSAAAWATLLSEILDRFFVLDDATENDIVQIRSVLTDEGLAGHAAAAGFDGLLSRDVVCAYLEQRFSSRIRHRGFISHGVTFCTLLPMRSIPFRVVYLLGMSDGEYPRTEQRPGFDLMESARRLCDRSKRHEDRFLFLEALLSARQRFFISYVGRSIKDNSRIPPSVVVCELQDYIRQAFGEDALTRITTEHPLQPFSPRYFANDPKLFSYSEHNYNAARALVGRRGQFRTFFPSPLPPPARIVQKIAVGDLIRFFMNPCEYLVRTRLNAALRPEDIPEPDDRMPLEPDALAQYLIRQEMLNASLRGYDVKELFAYIKASGKLPPGSGSAVMYAPLASEVMKFANAVASLTEGFTEEQRDVAVPLEKSGISIVGTIGNLFGSRHVVFRCARRSPKVLLKTWIGHLLLQASGGAYMTTLLDRDGAIGYEPLDAATAYRHVQELVSLFLYGLTEPLPFFPRASFAFAETYMKKQSSDKAYRAAEKTWYPNYSDSGEGDDEYIRLCFGNAFPRGDSFVQSSVTVFSPLLAHMQDIGISGDTSVNSENNDASA